MPSNYYNLLDTKMADISHDAVQEVLIGDGNLFQDSSIKDNIKDFCKRC